MWQQEANAECKNVRNVISGNSFSSILQRKFHTEINNMKAQNMQIEDLTTKHVVKNVQKYTNMQNTNMQNTNMQNAKYANRRSDDKTHSDKCPDLPL